MPSVQHALETLNPGKYSKISNFSELRFDHTCDFAEAGRAGIYLNVVKCYAGNAQRSICPRNPKPEKILKK